MVLKVGLASSSWWGGIMLWIIFAFWATLTVGILVLMEGLSAFLHTLRLHWYDLITICFDYMNSKTKQKKKNYFFF